jgi:UDP-sulfoquinovose synthase
MRILVLGGDGYLGWPTSMYLSRKGHEIGIVDSMAKRAWEAELGVEPLCPLKFLPARVKRWKELTGKTIKTYIGDISENHRFIYKVLEDFRPDAIVHYAEQPSAPYSMIDREKCVFTQRNNVIGTLNLMFAIQHLNPDIHMVKLGTMGEYGTPNIDIEEGWLEIEHNGRSDRVLYPKKPGSFYHLSKVHDSSNLEFACRIWGQRVTDLNQGVVYGIDTEETRMHPDLETSFHYDSVFGTVLNRFVVQAVCGAPLTVYGKGGQTRGYLNIKDTLQCVELALDNPANQGEFRVFNQFTEQFSVQDLANKVANVAKKIGNTVAIDHIENPRVELEEHYYNAIHSALPKLGLVPNLLTDEVIVHMMQVAEKNRDRIDSDSLAPTVKWKTN